MGEHVTHKGGCHCGDVEFEVSAPARLRVQECNCSICRMTGFLHLIVPASRFRLVRGAESLTTYAFNTGTAKHMFCAFGRPVSTNDDTFAVVIGEAPSNANVSS